MAIMKYKCRAECQFDVFKFMEDIAFGTVVITRPNPLFPDCEVVMDSILHKFLLVRRAKALTDCHVIAETLELEENYTGERT
jgi:hypothetical protein